MGGRASIAGLPHVLKRAVAVACVFVNSVESASGLTETPVTPLAVRCGIVR